MIFLFKILVSGSSTFILPSVLFICFHILVLVSLLPVLYFQPSRFFSPPPFYKYINLHPFQRRSKFELNNSFFLPSRISIVSFLPYSTLFPPILYSAHSRPLLSIHPSLALPSFLPSLAPLRSSRPTSCTLFRQFWPCSLTLFAFYLSCPLPSPLFPFLPLLFLFCLKYFCSILFCFVDECDLNNYPLSVETKLISIFSSINYYFDKFISHVCLDSK